MYYIGKFEESQFAVPYGYEQHSEGYERFALVDHSVGSVHMGVGICRLQPNGSVESSVHANEKGIYVLEGDVEIKRGGEGYRLSKDDYALFPYGVPQAYRNTSRKAARWFEMQAPQPKPPGGWQDKFFVGDADWPQEVRPPGPEDPRTRLLGHFREQRPEFPYGVGIQGLTVYLFMDREFGAQHFLLMRGELAVGGVCGLHDHPLEESYFVLSGEADMEIEGDRHHLHPGVVAWTGVGTSHGFFQRGKAPFRWIETQAPQFPTQNGFRNYASWDKLRTLGKDSFDP